MTLQNGIEDLAKVREVREKKRSMLSSQLVKERPSQKPVLVESGRWWFKATARAAIKSGLEPGNPWPKPCPLAVVGRWQP